MQQEQGQLAFDFLQEADSLLGTQHLIAALQGSAWAQNTRKPHQCCFYSLLEIECLQDAAGRTAASSPAASFGIR